MSSETERTDRTRRRLCGLFFASAAASLVPLRATLAADAAAGGNKRVIVLTSYPEALVKRFQTAFEQAYPGARLEILWRHSADALAYLRRGGLKEVDVYWTPAPRNFALLKQEGHLAKLALDANALPPTVAGYPISDPDGFFAAFELAG